MLAHVNSHFLTLIAYDWNKFEWKFFFIMDKVYRERAFFFALFNAADDYSLRRSLLKKMSRSQVKAIALVALNVLHGAIGVANEKRRQLIPIKPFLRSVSAEGASTSSRRRIILENVDRTFLLVKLLFRNLDLLIWRDETLDRK